MVFMHSKDSTTITENAVVVELKLWTMIIKPVSANA